MNYEEKKEITVLNGKMLSTKFVQFSIFKQNIFILAKMNKMIMLFFKEMNNSL